MDSLLNGKEIHVLNPLDLVGIGKHRLQLSIPTDVYWDMFKEQYARPLENNNGVENLFIGGNPMINVYPESFYKTWVFYSFGNESKLDDTFYEKNICYRFINTATSGIKDHSCNQFEGETQLKPNTTYTWQFMAKRIKGSMATLFGTDTNNLIDTSKNVIVDGVENIKIGTDPYYSWDKHHPDDAWYFHYMTFTTKSTLPNSKTFRFRVYASSDWKVKDIMITEGDSPKPWQPSEKEFYDSNKLRLQKGLKDAMPNMGFYYSEEYKFCSAYRVNTRTGFNTVGFNPVDCSYTVECEVENFAQILDPVKKFYIKPPSTVNGENSIMCNRISGSHEQHFLNAKAKGLYMQCSIQDENDRNRTYWDRSYINFYATHSWARSGGWFYTGSLQTQNKEN